MENKVSIYKEHYKSLSSVVMENEHIRIEMIPELGAKIVSLIYKPSGHEWLVDTTAAQLSQVEYGSSFAKGGMCGWDECFPTIDECRIGEHGEILLPDHGEVWSLPWDVQIVDRTIICSVNGRQLPYRLTRQIEFVDTDKVRLSYRVENQGNYSFPFTWAAHPQFRITEPTRVLLPEEMDILNCVYGEKEGTTGGEWPVPERWIIAAEADATGKKYYYPALVTEGWSGIRREHSNNYLILTTLDEKVPYLGIWIDKGLFNERSVIALEPAIGYYDSLDRAIANGTAVELSPGGEVYHWELVISLGQGDYPFGMFR